MNCFVQSFSLSLSLCACKDLDFFSLNKKQLVEITPSTRSVTNETKMLEAWDNTVHCMLGGGLGEG